MGVARNAWRLGDGGLMAARDVTINVDILATGMVALLDDLEQLREGLALVKLIHPPPWRIESQQHGSGGPDGPPEWGSEIVDANDHGVYSNDDYDDEQYQAMCDGFNLACERLE